MGDCDWSAICPIALDGNVDLSERRLVRPAFKNTLVSKGLSQFDLDITHCR